MVGELSHPEACPLPKDLIEFWLQRSCRTLYFLTDREGKILESSPGTCKMIGCRQVPDTVDAFFLDFDTELLQRLSGSASSTMHIYNSRFNREESFVCYIFEKEPGLYAWLAEKSNLGESELAKQFASLTSRLTDTTLRLTALNRELKAANEEIRQKNEILLMQARHTATTELLGMIAHQWRQPLTSINMCANNIQAAIELEMFDIERATHAITEIQNHAKALSKTIDEFSRVLSTQREAGSVQVSSVIQKAVSLIQKTLQDLTIRFTIKMTNDAEVHLVENDLIQVILNILNNAMEVLVSREVEGKQISLVTSQKEGRVQIDITDNGGGIDFEYRERLFDAYFSTKEERNSVGLGLCLSKMITEKQMGGSLSFENRDGGTCFSILLPIESPATKPIKEDAK